MGAEQVSVMPTILWKHVGIHRTAINTNIIRQLSNDSLPLFADLPAIWVVQNQLSVTKDDFQ